MRTPCSVKAQGKCVVPPLPFAATICDLKVFPASTWSTWNFIPANSKEVSLNIKSSGKRFRFSFTARFNAFVGTSYSLARSKSNITLSPLIS